MLKDAPYVQKDGIDGKVIATRVLIAERRVFFWLSACLLTEKFFLLILQALINKLPI